MSTLNDAPFPFPRAASQPVDTLADLFLGDGPLAPELATDPHNVGSPRPDVRDPWRRDLGVASSLHDAPAPVSGPLAGDAPEPHTQPAPFPEPAIEALILGHLPVLASVWVGQFARLGVESAGGPVALLRVRAGTASVDLFRAGADVAECATIDDAIRAANTCARRWIIQVDETEEPSLAALPNISALTLLCGADDAAVVACYRALKSLGARDETSEKVIRLAIMGATGDKAKAAAEKLASASRTFLGRDIELVRGANQVSAWDARTLFRGPSPASLGSLVSRLECRGTPAGASRAETTPASIPEIPVGRARSVTRTEAFRTALRDVMQPRVGTESAPQASGTDPIAAPPAPEPMASSPAGPLPSIAAAGLVGLIEGLAPIPLSCPVAPGVALARDAGGSLHLVARSDAAGDVGRAWCELDAAAGWATMNAPLLAAAAAVRSTAPARHLLAREPRAARRLLDSGVRVYALCAQRDGTPIAGVPLN